MTEGGRGARIGPHAPGVQVLVDDATAERAIRAAGLRLRDGITPEQVRDALRDALADTLLPVLSPGYYGHIRQLRNMRQLLERYAEEARELAHLDLFPPMLPRKWYDGAVQFFSELEEDAAERAKGGRPRNYLQQRFFPRALGLFMAAFGAKPTPTARRETSSDGPAARFLGSLVRDIGAAIKARGFADSVGRDASERLAWSLPRGAGMAEALRTALLRDHAVNGVPSGQKAFEIWARYYSDHFLGRS